MAAGKKIGTAVVLVALLVGLAAIAGVGSYLVMTDDDGNPSATADANDPVEGDDAVAAAAEGAADGDVPATDEEILAELAEMNELDDDNDDTGAPQISRAGAKMRANGKIGKRKAKGKTGKTRTRAVKKVAPAHHKSQDCSKITGVTKHSSNHYTLSQGFVSTYIKDSSKGQMQGAAGWSSGSSGREGVRIKQLRCAPRVAGMKNKDVITEIAGYKITTTAAAFLAYGDIKKADRFEIKVLRKGTPLTITYDVGTPKLPAEGEAAAEGDADAPAAEGDAAPAEGAADEGSAAEGADQ